MSATAIPNNGLPTEPDTVTKEWTHGMGETEVHEWGGLKSDIEDKYEERKSAAEAGENIANIIYKNQRGRATLLVRLGRQGNIIANRPADVSVIEELYAVDIIRDISAAPYWATTVGGKGLPLSDDQIAFVRNCAERNLTSTEITSAQVQAGLAAATYAWANWSKGMKELWWAMTHGVTSYYETGLVLRRSEIGLSTSQINASFTGVNTVVTDPVFNSPMDNLIELPDGEWLYRPPLAEHLGRGKWRITQEWHWAEAWSIVYGGTFNGSF